MANKNTKEQEVQQNLTETVSKTEVFLKENEKAITVCLAVLLVVALAILCYSKFYLQPKKAEAAAQLFHAEQQFSAGNYELAFSGDENYPGIEEIVDKYGNKAGKAVYMYAGVCSYEMGDFESALKYFKSYKSKEKNMQARAYACIGDCYVSLENNAEALRWFEKAAAESDNDFSPTYLVKAGETAEALGQADKALGFYKKIRESYPNSIEALDIDKYISRIEQTKAE